MHSRRFVDFSFLTSRTTPLPCSLIWILCLRNFWERAVSIARISLMPSPVLAEHGTIATFFVKSDIFVKFSALTP